MSVFELKKKPSQVSYFWYHPREMEIEIMPKERSGDSAKWKCHDLIEADVPKCETRRQSCYNQISQAEGSKIARVKL